MAEIWPLYSCKRAVLQIHSESGHVALWKNPDSFFPNNQIGLLSEGDIAVLREQWEFTTPHASFPVKDELKDEADYGLTHREVCKAIWNAKLSTEFIRENFILSEETNQEGQIRRFYLISTKGYLAIAKYLN